MRKAKEIPDFRTKEFKVIDDVWKTLMLEPVDYSQNALHHKTTRNLMDKMVFEHGGKAYDEKYPEGIPTSVVITLNGIYGFFFNYLFIYLRWN